METNRILFAGMHESGKTTFIAALWDYINSNKTDKKLILNTLANYENQYLEKIRSEWLQCIKVTRTNLNESETVHMDVLNATSSKNLILEIPDISGELYNSHFQHRQWNTDYENIVSHMQGILLFINPKDKRNRTKYIADALTIESEIESELDDKSNIEGTKSDNQNALKTPEETSVDKSIDFTNWIEEYTSNQVKLVETLQLIASRVIIQSPMRVSVVISKWDLIETNGSGTPLLWLKTNMPLLHQYLICSDDIFQILVYGVSAQGGDYGNEQERKRLLALEPHDKLQVKIENDFINDITAPIIWLTGN
jgi:hypothetical protein